MRQVTLISLLAFLLLGLAAPCRAQSFPLGPCFREGRFLPAMGQSASALQIRGAGGMDALWVDDFPSFGGAAWRSVPASTRWVGIVGGGRPPSTLPSSSLLTHLELADCLGSSAPAWNALDELVLTAADAVSLGEPWLAALAASGTQVRVRGALARGSTLPWREDGGDLVLSPPAAAAHVPLVAPAAYLPLDTLSLAQDSATRQRVIIIAALLAISLVAAAGALSRRYWPALGGGCVLMAAGLLLWAARLPASWLVSGSLYVEGEPSVRDQWLYLVARRDTRVTVTLVGGGGGVSFTGDTLQVGADLLLPVLESRAADCELVDGGRTCRLRLRQGQRLALLARKLGSGPPGVPAGLTPSPLRAVAESLYLGQRGYIRGEVVQPSAAWPSLIIAQREQALFFDTLHWALSENCNSRTEPSHQGACGAGMTYVRYARQDGHVFAGGGGWP